MNPGTAELKTVQITLDPTVEQQSKLTQMVGSVRFFYNYLLADVKRLLAAKETDPSVEVPWTAFSLSKHLTKRVTTDPDVSWYKEVTKYARETAAVRLAEGLSNWNASRTGSRKGRVMKFPRFKDRSYNESITLRIDIRPVAKVSKIVLPTLGEVRVFEAHQMRLVRTLVKKGGRITKATVRFDGRHWVCSILMHVHPLPEKVQHPHLDNEDGFSVTARAGVDLGLTKYATIASDSGPSTAVNVAAVENPRHLKNKEQALARTQRKFDRSQPRKVKAPYPGPPKHTPYAGRNREKLRRKVQVLHTRIRNTRKTFQHTLTKRLATQYREVTVESLNVAGMSKNKKLAKHVSDAAWGRLLLLLTYKCHKYNTTLYTVSTWFPSTQTCSQCGERREHNLMLKDRTFTCDPAGKPGCGHTADRDDNAATTLLVTAEKNLVMRTTPVVKPKAPSKKKTTAASAATV